jgi:hypothetical protein
MEQVKLKTRIFVKKHGIMSTVELKTELIQLIETEEDLSVLQALKLILVKIKNIEKPEEKELWDNLPEALKAEIEEGLEQAENGEVIEHEQVMKKYEKWL